MIRSTANPRIKWIRSLQAKRRARHAEGAFVLEGNRLANEVLQAKIAPQLVLHVQDLSQEQRALVQRLGERGAEVMQVSDSVMAACSNAETPQGLLVVAPIPELRPSDPLSLVLVIGQMNDPGNLGTLLRSALAAGVDLVYLMQGTVDPFNPKVVRGGMGAQLHLPIECVGANQLPDRLQGLAVWIAEPGRGIPYHQVDWRAPLALVIGSEAHGPPPDLMGFGWGQVTVPHDTRVESLNAAVAGSIILFEIARQRGAG